MLAIDKNRPSPAWIRELRRRYPCEQEIDRVLVRKLQHRAGPPYTPVSLETLCDSVRALIAANHSGRFEIVAPKWLSGGASKLQMAFTLRRPDHEPESQRMVVRMEPAASNVETSRLREFQVIRALEGVVPVPPVYWIDAEGMYFPYPAAVYGFAEGVTKPSGTSSAVSGVGTQISPKLRPVLARQFVDILAAIHSHDWRRNDLSAFDVPTHPTQAVEWQLNLWERAWEEDSNEDIPLLRFAAGWLRRNMPAVDRLSIVHGDFRTGNYLFTEDDNRISAVLDWELAHLGDRHEDLGYTLMPSLGSYADDGRTLMVSGLMTANEFLDDYERTCGLSLNRRVVDYYQVFGAYKLAVAIIGSGYRVARCGKTHQDVLLTYLMAIGYPMLDGLRNLLEEIA